MRSQTGAGGSTGATSTLSSPSRRSQRRTSAAKSGVDQHHRVGLRALVGIERAEHVFRREAVWYLRPCVMIRGTPGSSARLRRSQVLIVFAGAVELHRKLVAAPAAVIGEQHHAPAIFLKLAEAGEQAPEFLGHLAPRQRVRFLSGRLHGGRLVLDRGFALLADQVERPVTRDRHHPGDRGCQFRVETAGIVPDLQIGLLYDLVGEVASPQDTQRHAIQFRPRGGVQTLKGRLIALGDGGHQPHEFRRRQQRRHALEPHPHRRWPGRCVNATARAGTA